MLERPRGREGMKSNVPAAAVVLRNSRRFMRSPEVSELVRDIRDSRGEMQPPGEEGRKTV